MKIRFDNLAEYLDIFFRKRMKLIIFVVAIFMAAYAVYIWYGCLYKPEWSQAQIEEYISKKEKNIIFQKEKFESVVGIFDERKKDFSESHGDLSDIFNLKK